MFVMVMFGSVLLAGILLCIRMINTRVQGRMATFGALYRHIFAYTILQICWWSSLGTVALRVSVAVDRLQFGHIFRRLIIVYRRCAVLKHQLVFLPGNCPFALVTNQLVGMVRWKCSDRCISRLAGCFVLVEWDESGLRTRFE
jgi:hypothetical protein